MSEIDITTWAETVDGLRALADFLEANPTVPVNPYRSEIQITMSARTSKLTEAEQRAEIDRIAALFRAPVMDSTRDGGHYETQIAFGLVRYKISHIPAVRMDEWYGLMSYRDSFIRAERAA